MPRKAIREAVKKIALLRKTNPTADSAMMETHKAPSFVLSRIAPPESQQSSSATIDLAYSRRDHRPKSGKRLGLVLRLRGRWNLPALLSSASAWNDGASVPTTPLSPRSMNSRTRAASVCARRRGLGREAFSQGFQQPRRSGGHDVIVIVEPRPSDSVLPDWGLLLKSPGPAVQNRRTESE